MTYCFDWDTGKAWRAPVDRLQDKDVSTTWNRNGVIDPGFHPKFLFGSDWVEITDITRGELKNIEEAHFKATARVPGHALSPTTRPCPPGWEKGVSA